MIAALRFVETKCGVLPEWVKVQSKSTALRNIELFIKKHPLRVHRLAGSEPTLVVSFTSVGTKREVWPDLEFPNLASQGGRNHVLFISDKSRSWMNSPGLDEEISQCIADYCVKHQINRVVTLGVSMGASNALICGQNFPVDLTIALSPQYSVHPKILPDESRWTHFRNAISQWPYPAITELPRSPTKVFILHGDSEEEERHSRHFGRAHNVQHYILPGHNHKAVTRFDRTGPLRHLVKGLILNDQRCSDAALAELQAQKRV